MRSRPCGLPDADGGAVQPTGDGDDAEPRRAIPSGADDGAVQPTRPLGGACASPAWQQLNALRSRDEFRGACAGCWFVSLDADDGAELLCSLHSSGDDGPFGQTPHVVPSSVEPGLDSFFGGDL